VQPRHVSEKHRRREEEGGGRGEEEAWQGSSHGARPLVAVVEHTELAIFGVFF